MSTAVTTEHAVDAVRAAWGGRVHLTTEGRIFNAPPVRDGGATDTLIRLAVETTLALIADQTTTPPAPTEETPVTVTTEPTPALPPLTAEEVAATHYDGGPVPVVFLGEDDDTIMALGHWNADDMADSVNAALRDVHGTEPRHEDRATRADVETLHAVVTYRPTDADYADGGEPDDWQITWRDVTPETPGAFPITVVTL